MAQELLTAAQAAQRLGLSAAHIRRLCAAGRLPGAQRPGHDWLIPAAAVEIYRAQGRRRGPRLPAARDG